MEARDHVSEGGITFIFLVEDPDLSSSPFSLLKPREFEHPIYYIFY